MVVAAIADRELRRTGDPAVIHLSSIISPIIRGSRP
jgi:hypothetical protein